MQTSFLKKYQPKIYKDFLIKPEYIKLLKSLQRMNNLNLLIMGNNGSGKSSLLFATINEYYKNIDNNTRRDNILYINNLKEQGIQYYRNELKTFCQTKSIIPNKKKIIVLDDIDMINEQSQQVFRNCIDKYSHNVHFLCSCINSQKVIDSIQSRCTIIKLNSFTNNNLYKILKNIQIKEQIEIDEESINFIINISNNSLRQIINYLEKLKILNKKIYIKDVQNICSNISFYEFEKYTNNWLKKKNIKQAVEIIYNIFDKGYSVMDILDCYFSYIKISKEIDETIKYKIIKVICKYITIFHNIHENSIELVLFTNELTKI
jgi:replication factor C subunit 2/4